MYSRVVAHCFGGVVRNSKAPARARERIGLGDPFKLRFTVSSDHLFSDWQIKIFRSCEASVNHLQPHLTAGTV